MFGRDGDVRVLTNAPHRYLASGQCLPEPIISSYRDQSLMHHMQFFPLKKGLLIAVYMFNACICLEQRQMPAAYTTGPK